MKALQYQGPNKLRWVNIEPPRIEASDDVIVRPLAVATCDLDWEIVAGRTPFMPPFTLGHEFVGEVVHMGEEVQGFSKGDKVSVAFQPSCGKCRPCQQEQSSACRTVYPTSMFGVGEVSGGWGGAFADLIRVPFANIMLIKINATRPLECYPSVSDNIADGLRTLRPFIDDIENASILVFGGYDSIPLYAVDLAHSLGASKVTFVTQSQRAARNATKLGADVLIVSEWSKRLKAHDISICAVGQAEALAAAIRSTRAGGHCSVTSIFSEDVTMPLREMYMRGIHLHTGRVNSVATHQNALSLIETGVIDPRRVDTTIVNSHDLIPELLNRRSAKLVWLNS